MRLCAFCAGASSAAWFVDTVQAETEASPLTADRSAALAALQGGFQLCPQQELTPRWSKRPPPGSPPYASGQLRLNGRGHESELLEFLKNESTQSHTCIMDALHPSDADMKVAAGGARGDEHVGLTVLPGQTGSASADLSYIFQPCDVSCKASLTLHLWWSFVFHVFCSGLPSVG